MCAGKSVNLCTSFSPLPVNSNSHFPSTPPKRCFVSAHGIGNEKIDVFALNFPAAVFHSKFALAFEQCKSSSPILRPVRNKFNARSKRNFGIGRNSAPVNFLTACELTVLPFLHVDANGTVAIGRHQVKMSAPRVVINRVECESEKRISDKGAFQTG